MRTNNIPSCFLMFFFSLLLLQCDFNINLMPYSVSPTFFTPYDAQAFSACSALIMVPKVFEPLKFEFITKFSFFRLR